MFKMTASELQTAYEEGMRDFSEVDLSNENLRGAKLTGADLRGAFLTGASLYGAKLRGAKLDGADLRGAFLAGADLRGAKLDGAKLHGADLPDGYYTVQFNHVGRRGGCTVATVFPDGTQEVRTGCFSGTLAEFEAAVAKKPEGDEYRWQYETIVIPGIRAFFNRYGKQGNEQS